MCENDVWLLTLLSCLVLSVPPLHVCSNSDGVLGLRRSRTSEDESLRPGMVRGRPRRRLSGVVGSEQGAASDLK